MTSIRYLNGILTVIALLLAVHAWTLFSGGNSASPQISLIAEAQAASAAEPPTGGGIPNAGAQRQQIVDMLKRLSQQTETMTDLFRSGQARVRVENAASDNKRPAK